MMATAKQLKELLNSIDDDEQVVLHIRPAMNDVEADTFTVERVTYIALTYHKRMPPNVQVYSGTRGNRANNK
jgi:hypothetical protein